jgi:hypothetical protein
MADAIRIIVRGFDTATAEIQAAVTTGIHKGLLAAGQRGEALVKENISSPFLGRPPAVSSGNLANSIVFELSQEVGFSRAIVFAGAPSDYYAGYVESGTGPHFPPPSALLLWVKKKFHPSTEKQALSIAFVVARGIARRGTSAFGMFARAFATLKGELSVIFQGEIAKAIEAAGLGPAGPGKAK